MKRFTETNKWSDPWFRKLSPKLKCLWQWLCDTACPAGTIDPDFELASFCIGEKVSAADLEKFPGRIEKLPNGRYLIVKFILFQYGELSHECRAHGPVFKSIEQNKIPYPYPINRVSDRDGDTHKDKEKDQDKDKDKERPKPIGSPNFVAFVKTWCDNFKAFHAFDYCFDGPKDGKAVKELLSKGILLVDLHEIAKAAWARNRLDGQWNCKQATTIFGFANQLNHIREELKNGPNKRPNGPSPVNRNQGTFNDGDGAKYENYLRNRQVPPVRDSGGPAA